MNNKMRKYITKLIKDDRDYHEEAIERTQQYVYTPADRQWIANHAKRAKIAKKMLKKWRNK